MKPLQHARITAHRYGGEWQDWITVHDWIDRSKVIFPSMQHRMFLHSDFGEWLAIRIHDEMIVAGDGTFIPTRDLFRDHQVEDLGRVVTLAEWLREIDTDYWTRRRKPPRHLEQVREAPAEGLAARWGGVPGDYLALIDFFDKPSEFAPESPDAAAMMITYNSFGIFLAEELLGTVIPLTETNDSRQVSQIISTRSAAEDLVYARIGSIPPAGNLAARTRLKLWMCGTKVGAALKTRRTNERAAAERN
ncbi:MAG TPA: hypothetical protein VFY40_06860 [Blastocatellia bacterium]|nr:hypothetical protein [Blastocatellia bacterium]